MMARYAESNAQLHAAAAHSQAGELKAFGDRLAQVAQASETRLDALRRTLEERLDMLRAENAQKLEQMRATVDEKLQATLEQRLGASFKQVSERLEQVHTGLARCRSLATGVGDLKRVLTNVKSRGTWGEVQLGALLADMLHAAASTRRTSRRVPAASERVEFAVRFPGRSEDGAPCWLPIDAKFPLDDWQRLQDAIERADAAAVEASRRALEQFFKVAGADDPRQVRRAAAHDRFRDPVRARRKASTPRRCRAPGLADTLQREFRVTLAGPTNLAAMLNSLQLGFRTLAIEKRSTEVWRVLGAVKTEFGKFGALLAKTKDKLDQVGQHARRRGPQEHDDRAQAARRRSAARGRGRSAADGEGSGRRSMLDDDDGYAARWRRRRAR